MNLEDLFKQAKDVQARAEQMQAALAAIEVDGVSGGGLVRLTLDGKSQLKQMALDPTLLTPEDSHVVEDLIVAAHADAKVKLERRVAEEMQKIAGSLGLPPGFGLA